MPYLASDARYNSMPYNRTSNSGLKLPQISLGGWYNFGGRDMLENGRAGVRTISRADGNRVGPAKTCGHLRFDRRQQCQATRR